MNTLVIPDLHLGLSWDGLDRTQDVFFTLDKILSQNLDIDEIVWLGDIFHSPNVPHTIVAKFINLLNDLDDVTHIILKGNHDGEFGGRKGSPLEEIAAAGFKVINEPEICNDDLYLPYCTYIQLDDIKRVVDNANLNFKYCFSHLDIPEAMPGLESEISRSSKCILPDWVYERCNKVISGHIHKGQSLRGGKVEILGSVLKVSVAEADDPKRYCIIEDDKVTLKDIKTRNVKDYRITFDKGFDSGSIQVEKDDIVSVEITVPHNIAHTFDFRALEKKLRESCYHLRFNLDVVKEKCIRNKEINTRASDFDIFNTYVKSQKLKDTDLVINEFKSIMESCNG